MLNCYKEIRSRKRRGVYDLTLEIPENDFFKEYKSPNMESAKGIIDNYLHKRRDLGRVDKIDIHHDVRKHMIQLTTELDYNNEYR